MLVTGQTPRSFRTIDSLKRISDLDRPPGLLLARGGPSPQMRARQSPDQGQSSRALRSTSITRTQGSSVDFTANYSR
jgi:hypothetical protein